MIFDAHDYTILHGLFSEMNRYAGYKPHVRELPNGDGNVDAEKRFLHVALKYAPPRWAKDMLARAHFRACQIAEEIGCPDLFYPRVADGTLRVLEYPEGAGSAIHTDFDLFSVNCWRNIPSDLETPANPGRGWRELHLGELGEIVGLGTAEPHTVPGRPYLQKAIVYFAMPNHRAVLPEHAGVGGVPWEPGQTVAQWLEKRYARSRLYT